MRGGELDGAAYKIVVDPKDVKVATRTMIEISHLDWCRGKPIMATATTSIAFTTMNITTTMKRMRRISLR